MRSDCARCLRGQQQPRDPGQAHNPLQRSASIRQAGRQAPQNLPTSFAFDARYHRCAKAVAVVSSGTHKDKNRSHVFFIEVSLTRKSRRQHRARARQNPKSV